MLEHIKEKRQQEIKEGKNAITANPIYVVYDVLKTYVEHDSAYDGNTTWFDHPTKYVRVSLDSDCCMEETDLENLEMYKTIFEDGEVVYHEEDETLSDELYRVTYRPALREFRHDKFVTVCFTRDGAEKFIEEERHNLINPQIFVHYGERRNKELMEILEILGG